MGIFIFNPLCYSALWIGVLGVEIVGMHAAKRFGMLESMFEPVNYQATKAFMDIAAERQKVLTGNLANSETPGYQRMELSPSFEGALKSQLAAGIFESFDAKAIPFSPDASSNLMADASGNNVSAERELMLINENALRYEALGQFASSSLRQLQTAITGRVS